MLKVHHAKRAHTQTDVLIFSFGSKSRYAATLLTVNLPPQNVSAVGKCQQLESVTSYLAQKKEVCSSPSAECGWGGGMALVKLKEDMGAQKKSSEKAVKIFSLGGKKYIFLIKNTGRHSAVD